ncbi:MAG: choice-of-anchor J domain-containing protein [Chitinophagaceae bacterium]
MKKLYLLFFALMPLLVLGQITWNFGAAVPGSASPSSGGSVTNITSISDLSQGNNNGTTALLTAASVSSGYTGASGNVNAGAAAKTGALNTAASGSAYFEFTLTPATGYSVFITEIDFGSRSTSTGPQAYSIRTSKDNFAADVTTGTIGNNSTWVLKTNALSLTGVAGTALTIRIYGYNGTGSPVAGTANWRIDDLAVTATATSSGGGSTPSITLNGTGLTPFSTVTGTASTAQTITVSGSNLTDPISITPPAPYEISIDGGTNYSTTALQLTPTTGSVTNASVSIRIASSAPVGTASGNLVATSSGASDQSLLLSGNVSSGVTVDPPLTFTATPVTSSEIDLAATFSTTANNILIATNSSATFGTPTGALVAGNSISGGGTVLYNGPSASFTGFQHTGLTAATKYYYQVWGVDNTSTYSTALAANATTNNPPAAKVVINQVYGGGGNSGATFKNDFIELYNDDDTAVNLAGWSVQYGGGTGTGNFTVHSISGIIQPHNFFLIQEIAGTGGTVNLPTPDATGTLSLGAAAGKVLLCNSTVAQSGSNPTYDPLDPVTKVIRDKVGYGTANGSETAPTAAPDNTTSVQRNTDGVDSENNFADFFVGTPVPRNSSYKTTPPSVVTLTPPTNRLDVPSTLGLSILFDKKMVKGSGTITIYENGVAGASVDVNDASIAISGNTLVTINTTLSPGKSYYVLVTPGAFADVYGNNFAGLTSNTAWAFSTYNSTASTTLPQTYDFNTCSGSGLLPNGFTQYSVTGAQKWDCANSARNSSSGLIMNGYSNGINNLNEDWLISPKLDLTGTTYPLLNFWSYNDYAGDPLVLKISTNYTGSGDPSLATWTDLNGKFPSSGSAAWFQSTNINLSAYKQDGIYLAWVYKSTTDDGSLWMLDDVSLVNSATPPPPSLTLSASNLEFGYTSTGNTTTKTLTLTANDLVGDVTLNTTGNFLVSANGTDFNSSVTIPKETANNVPLTLSVRFSPNTNNIQYSETLSVAISDSTGIVTLKGNSIDPASTLNVVNWNLNWFATPVPSFGPVNKSLQQDNVATVLKSIPADLFALQEVVNVHALDSIVNTMPGYAYIVNNYGSYSNPTLKNASPLTEVQKLAFVYKTSKFSNIHTDSLLTKGVTLAIDTLSKYYNPFASGRFPYMMTADVTLSDNNGGFITQKMHFINIHGKANTAPVLTAYNRRFIAAQGLDSLIKADYINDNVVILGDFNDDLNHTITAGISPNITSYSPFTVDDASLYIFPTIALSPAQHSDANFVGSVIDNVVATAGVNKYYLPGSATVLSDVANLVSKYSSTTTDHYPVFTQFSFSTQAALPVTLASFTASRLNDQVKVSWKSTEEINSSVYIVQRSADGVSFTTIGQVNAKGYAADYSLVDPSPIIGDNYYRLKAVDKDGKFTYSKVVKVNFTKLPGIRISPNPASSYLYINLENINSSVSLQLIDLNGKTVSQQIIAPGQTNKTISLSGMAKGLYSVKLVSKEKVVTQKLLIQ